MGLEGEHSDTDCTDLLLYLMCVVSDTSVMGHIFSFHLCPVDELAYISISLMDGYLSLPGRVIRGTQGEHKVFP